MHVESGPSIAGTCKKTRAFLNRPRHAGVASLEHVANDILERLTRIKLW